MGFDLNDRINSLQGMLGGIADKQKINSDNIANAHTPGYTAKKVSFGQVLNGLSQQPFETSLSQKMGSNFNAQNVEDTGKAVDLQQELVDMQKNNLYYNVAIRRTSTLFNALRTAGQVGR